MVPQNLWKQFTDYLSPFITKHKKNLIEEILNKRTRFVTLALEDIYQTQNASAIVRTCDCLSIQNVHIIENRNKYGLNPNVELGSSQWVNLIRHNQGGNNSSNCLKKLKSEGYKIVGTALHENSQNLPDFNLREPVALVFGTELEGLSEEALLECDQLLRIPMYGFTESYNISVSASIILYHLIQLLYSSDLNWKLTEKEKDELRIKWYKNIVKQPDKMEADFLKKTQ